MKTSTRLDIVVADLMPADARAVVTGCEDVPRRSLAVRSGFLSLAPFELERQPERAVIARRPGSTGTATKPRFAVKETVNRPSANSVTCETVVPAKSKL